MRAVWFPWAVLDFLLDLNPRGFSLLLRVAPPYQIRRWNWKIGVCRLDLSLRAELGFLVLLSLPVTARSPLLFVLACFVLGYGQRFSIPCICFLQIWYGLRPPVLELLPLRAPMAPRPYRNPRLGQ